MGISVELDNIENNYSDYAIHIYTDLDETIVDGNTYKQTIADNYNRIDMPAEKAMMCVSAIIKALKKEEYAPDKPVSFGLFMTSEYLLMQGLNAKKMQQVASELETIKGYDEWNEFLTYFPSVKEDIITHNDQNLSRGEVHTYIDQLNTHFGENAAVVHSLTAELVKDPYTGDEMYSGGWAGASQKALETALDEIKELDSTYGDTFNPEKDIFHQDQEYYDKLTDIFFVAENYLENIDGQLDFETNELLYGDKINIVKMIEEKTTISQPTLNITLGDSINDAAMLAYSVINDGISIIIEGKDGPKDILLKELDHIFTELESSPQERSDHINELFGTTQLTSSQRKVAEDHISYAKDYTDVITITKQELADRNWKVDVPESASVELKAML